MKPITKEQAEYIRNYINKTRKKWNKIFNSDEFISEKCELLELARHKQLSYRIFKDDRFKNFANALRENNISTGFAFDQINIEKDDTGENVFDIPISMTCHDKSKGKRKKRYLTETPLSAKLLSDYERNCVKIIYDSNFPDKYKNK